MIYYYIIYNGDWIAITKDKNIFLSWFNLHIKGGLIKIDNTNDFKKGDDNYIPKYYYQLFDKVKHLL